MTELILLVLTVVAVTGYGLALTRLRRRGDHWPARRTGCLIAGAATVAAALLPPIGSHDENFPVHVGQHLLLGMAGPTLLVLSAPMTIALRTLPCAARRRLLTILHSRVAEFVAQPATAVLLGLGGLYALYLTGLYQLTLHNDLVHALVHLHMFLAGCLLSWALIGVDPVRHRPGARTRLIALGLAGAGHDVLAKWMYARSLPAGGGALASRQLGAEMLYYGGTVMDLALAIILLAQWYRAAGRELTRSARRRAIARPAPPRRPQPDSFGKTGSF